MKCQSDCRKQRQATICGEAKGKEREGEGQAFTGMGDLNGEAVAASRDGRRKDCRIDGWVGAGMERWTVGDLEW
jgi:hypothetical protein